MGDELEEALRTPLLLGRRLSLAVFFFGIACSGSGLAGNDRTLTVVLKTKELPEVW
jgi:hypothetical protein